VENLRAGIYEELVTEAIDRRLRMLDQGLVDRGSLDPADAYEVLTRHLSRLSRRALLSVSGSDSERLLRQVDLANRIAEAIAVVAPSIVDTGDLIADSRDLLRAIAERAGVPGPARFPDRPDVPLAASALLVNGRDQPRIGVEVQKELASADRVDLLCAFVKWYGVRVLENHIDAFVRRRHRMRVLTMTYTGATERRALDRLAQLGAEVKVSYETHTTRLHAKAWMFHRDTGFSTAYVGSSNLSKSALLDGLEWNVRLSAVEQGHLLDTFRAAFDEYWEDPAFEPYDPDNADNRARLDEALDRERGGPTTLPIDIAALEVRPWGYQREILDELVIRR
jgi:HKD family nuclease